MTWFKVDDQIASHVKVVTAGNAAMGLWVRAGAWCCANLTDGFVHADAARMLGGQDADIQALIDADLWVSVPGGYQFHDWAEYQPTAASERSRREKDRIRKRKEREAAKAKVEVGADGRFTSKRKSSGMSERTGDRRPPLPDPDPLSVSTDVETRVEDSIEVVRADVDELIALLDSELEVNGAKPTGHTKRNREAMRLMIDKDGHTPEQIAAAIRWCQANEFWRANILSAAKLREKYDTLRLQAQREQRSGNRVHENAQVVYDLARELGQAV
ncbi:hypothetical protein M3D15_04700 [Pseudoclavibacter alba]|uniref:DUF3102 domain-containing protein n=1 Tax=Pseudoclavibacter albus TaxID=272241 RepID=A0ABT2HWD1_9MICO|nr:hypothetical protein [Pseudoclavibacter alba]MCT2042634.1 hypothetical protein [Pseudoclavibacter alba]